MTSEVKGHGDGFTYEDVVYHSPGGHDLLARLYRPSTPGPWPAVVDAHGGRWCAEDRLTNVAIDESLARAGIFVMALDFRMPPLARYPGPVSDINYAIRWLHAHAQSLGVKAEWIGGVGTSSGGHQLMLNALRPNDYTVDHPTEASAPPAHLHYAIFCWPVSDPPARYAYARGRNMEIHIQSHDAYWGSLEAMQEGSPQRIVADGTKRNLPPAQMIQGTADEILAPGMTDCFVEAWRAAQGEIDYEIFPGEGHTFITKKPDSPAAKEAIRRMIAFINKQTRG
jgi:acetyl esterase/lipase